jgi:hypothetical protein
METDIDFKEIEKAMADLVNKTQSHARKKELTKVVKKRDEIAKKAENSREQGRVATKRIIIGSKSLRANAVGIPVPAPLAPEPTPAPSSQVPRSNLNPNNIISDFKTSKSFIPPAADVSNQAQLNQSVGDLSDQFLQEEIATSNSTAPENTKLNSLIQPEEDLAEPEFVQPESPPPLAAQPIQPEPTPQQELPEEPDSATEPALLQDQPDQSEHLQQTQSSNVTEDIGSDQEPPIYNPNSGAIHRMYGQRMKTPIVNQQAQTSVQSPELTKAPKQKKKKGFLFYFVLLLTLAALGVWGYVGYIFFVPKS